MAALTDNRFWVIIDDARLKRPLSEERVRAVRDELRSGWNARQLAEFHAVLLGWSAALDRNDLWAAASTLLGTPTDEKFLEFRTWLILQGKTAIEEIVAAPDSLAGMKFAENPTAPGLYGIPAAICEEAYGAPLEVLHFAPDVSAWPADRVADRSITEEECAKLFPKIARKPLWKKKVKAPRKPAGPSKYEVARAGAVGDPQPYARDKRFGVGALVEHPSLGVGVVTAAHSDRVEVLFADKPRVLLHAGK